MPRIIKFDQHTEVGFIAANPNQLLFNNRNNHMGFVANPLMQQAFLNAYSITLEDFEVFTEIRFYEVLQTFEEGMGCDTLRLNQKGIAHVLEQKEIRQGFTKILRKIDAPAADASLLPMVEYVKSLLSEPVFKKLYEKKLSNTLLVLTQQGFSSVSHVVQGLLDLGFPPENLIVFTKPHTTSLNNEMVMRNIASRYHFQYVCRVEPSEENSSPDPKVRAIQEIVKWVDRKLTESASIENAIYYDEGGVLTKHPEFQRTCVDAWKETKRISMSEHTMSGVATQENFLTDIACLMMARSWIKIKCEPYLIAESSYLQIRDQILNLYQERRSLILGLVGCGNIGKEFARFLIELSQDKQIVIQIHDQRFNHPHDYPEDLIQLSSAIGVDVRFSHAQNNENLFNTSDIIFGATGTDISRCLIHPHHSQREKILVSISSGKREFESLVDLMNEDNKVQYLGQTYHLMNQGFPINFNQADDAVHPQKIQLIRALTLVTVFQQLMHLQKMEVIEKTNQVPQQHSRFMRLNAFFQYMLWHQFKVLQRDMPQDLKLPDRILNQACSLQTIIHNDDNPSVHLDNSLPHEGNLLDEFDDNHLLHYLEKDNKIEFVFCKHGQIVQDVEMLDDIFMRNEFERESFNLESSASQSLKMEQSFRFFNPSAMNQSEKNLLNSYQMPAPR